MIELNSVRDIAAFNAGIRAAREAALIVAVTLEVREGSTYVRDRAAIRRFGAWPKVSTR